MCHVGLQLFLEVLVEGAVVDQDDVVDEAVRGPVEDRVDGPEEDGPALVVEADDDVGARESLYGNVSVRSLSPLLPHVRQGPVDGDHVAHVLVERVVLPPLVNLGLGLRVGVLNLDRLPHFSGTVGILGWE